MNMFEVSWKSDRRASDTFFVGHACQSCRSSAGGGAHPPSSPRPPHSGLLLLAGLGSSVGKVCGLVGWLVLLYGITHGETPHY